MCRTPAVVLVIAVAALWVGCRAAIDPAVISDAQTAVRVKTVLVNDPDLGELPIEVRVVGGVAELSGRVRSATQIERARRLAASVPGVRRVQANLQIGADPVVTPVVQPEARRSPQEELEIDPAPGLLALGGSLGWSVPGPAVLRTRVALSPLLKLGSPRGLGPAVGFDWFKAELEPAGRGSALTRIHVKPVMAGLGYTVTADRFSFAPSVVGGAAFNNLTVTSTGPANGLPVEVDNSFVWRVGVSAWYDVSRRVAVNISAGYLMTELELTVIEQDHFVKKRTNADTTIVHVGLAYRLF